jgi:hypothetical protein
MATKYFRIHSFINPDKSLKIWGRGLKHGGGPLEEWGWADTKTKLSWEVQSGSDPTIPFELISQCETFDYLSINCQELERRFVRRQWRIQKQFYVLNNYVVNCFAKVDTECYY